MIRILLLTLLLTPLAGLGQSDGSSIYRTTDEHGNVVFTDAPPTDAGSSEAVEIKHINTAPPPPKMEAPATKPAGPAEDSEASGYEVSITSPANETSIPRGPGNFSVTASIHPALEGGESLQLFMDGAPHGAPQNTPSWDLTNVFRGQHDLTVGVIDGKGNTLSVSDPVRVYVFRPSSNF